MWEAGRRISKQSMNNAHFQLCSPARLPSTSGAAFMVATLHCFDTAVYDQICLRMFRWAVRIPTMKTCLHAAYTDHFNVRREMRLDTFQLHQVQILRCAFEDMGLAGDAFRM